MKNKHFLFLLLSIVLTFSILSGCGSDKDEIPENLPSITDISIDELSEDYTPYRIDELHVLGKYAFITVDEYYDSESGYSDDTYYVYTGDQPMDNNDLFEEHYLVMFYDGSGEPHLASMSNRDWDFSETIKGATPSEPVVVSVNVSVAQKEDLQVSDDKDEELNNLRKQTLNAVSEYYDIPNEYIAMGYKSSNN